MAFDPLKPADGLACPSVDDQIRDNFAAIQKGEHFTGTTEPTYKQEGTPWYDSTNDLLKIYDGADWDIVLTRTDGLRAQGANYKVDSGVVSVPDTTATAITFNFTFTTAPTILLTIERSSGSDLLQRTAFIASKSTTGATVIQNNNQSVNVHWVAIGTV